jgi:hypothetical protein
MEECKLYGMKSHDCHLFMQTLIPLDLCSSKLNVDHIERLETNIIETLCKLEMIFPPSFVDSMEHLPYIYRLTQKLEDRSSIDGCTH